MVNNISLQIYKSVDIPYNVNHVFRNTIVTVAGFITCLGTMALMPKKDVSMTQMLGVKGVVNSSFKLVDDTVDTMCRCCESNDGCSGPVGCSQDQTIPRKLSESGVKISEIYSSGVDRERISDLVEKFHLVMSKKEMGAVHAPPENEKQIRHYREDTLWPWAQMMVALTEGSTIGEISEERLSFPPCTKKEQGLIFRIFYAGMFHQVLNDLAKYNFHRQQKIPGFGYTISDQKHRIKHCQKQADIYKSEALNYGASPAILSLFKKGYSTIQRIKRMLPKEIQMNTVFTT